MADKLYEKRKTAALEVEQVARAILKDGDRANLDALISTLVNDFVAAPTPNHRKGGLIGLAAVTVALAGAADPNLHDIVPPVLRCFTDADQRVRYYACEALYNIAKAQRGVFVAHFAETFDALCKLSADADPNVQNAAHLLDRLVKDIVTESVEGFDVAKFAPQLRERIGVLNPYVRQFLVGWITALDSVPEIDMLTHLPDMADGLLNMLSDPNREIRQQADGALGDFLAEIKGEGKSAHRNADLGALWTFWSRGVAARRMSSRASRASTGSGSSCHSRETARDLCRTSRPSSARFCRACRGPSRRFGKRVHALRMNSWQRRWREFVRFGLVRLNRRAGWTSRGYSRR